MNKGGAKKRSPKAKYTNQNKNSPFGYPPSKNWEADCFPGLGNKPDGPYRRSYEIGTKQNVQGGARTGEVT